MVIVVTEGEDKDKITERIRFTVATEDGGSYHFGLLTYTVQKIKNFDLISQNWPQIK